ncbi:ATP-binding protein [Goekera deserti]|uniref:ATP-binding protein n=1 Tax=Goekera deserti TaxID=2497753 RepID=UPI001F2AC5F2|nr:ATP-binding protein [Goekera deserti]
MSDLPRVRAELRRHLVGAGEHRDPDAVADATDQLVLAFDEMSSNALRHGGGGVVSSVRGCTGGWLVEVCDDDAHTSPTPAVDRDPSQGGLGLYLIAELAVDHGWQVRAGHKAVWAVLPWPAPAPPA